MASPKKVTDWTAKRAGGRITINGVDAKGAPIKIVGVDTIASRTGKSPLATDKDGNRFELA